ncbi:MAG TPA: sortase, partial [Wenzhouxiangella sp.]|nr:sortase [Wenzhouxiangella sp.]
MKTHFSYRLAETALWVVGAAVLSLVAYTLVDDEVERRQALDLFSEARAEMLVSVEDQPGSLPADSSAAVLLADRQRQADIDADTDTDTVAQPATAQNLPIAVLRINGVGLEVPVFANTSEDNLSRGAGWVAGTARPNDGGNMAIAAHRDRYFRPLKDVKVGEQLDLLSLDG